MFKHILVLSLAILCASAVDYCEDMHCMGKPHVGCNNPLSNGGFGPSCSAVAPNASLIHMSSTLKQIILDKHNEFRNQQALGKIPHYEPATRMATIQWDDELAKLAELNVRKCEFAHDACINTKRFYPVGQNIAMQMAPVGFKGDSDDKVLASLVKGWSDEHSNGGASGWMKFINNFKMPPITDEEHQIGHFSQLVRMETTHIGCASSSYMTNVQGQDCQATLLTCNYYAANPYPDHKVYEAGPTASKCQSGTNPEYPGLCSAHENYN